jgi:hypothetical protein
MTAAPSTGQVAKGFGQLLWIAGLFLIFVAENRWKQGVVCVGFGGFLCYLGCRKEAERCPVLSGSGRSPAPGAPKG